MGPDEPHEWVDDNRFTNAIARWNSEAALDALGWLRHSPQLTRGSTPAGKGCPELLQLPETPGFAPGRGRLSRGGRR